MSKRAKKAAYHAEQVCRALRYNIANCRGVATAGDLWFAHLERWLRLAKKEKYQPPDSVTGLTK